MLSQLKGVNWKTSLAFLLTFSERGTLVYQLHTVMQAFETKVLSFSEQLKKINLHILLLYKEHTSSSRANIYSSILGNLRD